MNRTGTASRHVDAWTCQTCTFANEPSHVVCAVCFVQKPNAPVGPFNRRNETKDETKSTEAESTPAVEPDADDKPEETVATPEAENPEETVATAEAETPKRAPRARGGRNSSREEQRPNNRRRNNSGGEAMEDNDGAAFGKEELTPAFLRR